MNKLNILQQMFGDLNRELNKLRARMNREIRERCFSEKAKKLQKAFSSSD